MKLTNGVGHLINRVQMDCQYPGQTMMVALAILFNFNDLKSAKEKGKTFSRASECGAIPGAGDAVSIALYELEEGIGRDLSSSEMIQRLNERWSQYAGNQSCYAEAVHCGLEKAKPYESEFVKRWGEWKERSLEKFRESVDS